MASARDIKDKDTGHHSGPHNELASRQDVRETLKALENAGIDLLSYGIVITDVYPKGEGEDEYGFDFTCKRSKQLLAAMNAMAGQSKSSANSAKASPAGASVARVARVSPKPKASAKSKVVALAMPSARKRSSRTGR